jgi:hypothetical protein
MNENVHLNPMVKWKMKELQLANRPPVYKPFSRNNNEHYTK